MPDDTSRPSPDDPWESGWAPDTSRAPGTRRLWLAGALVVATVAGCLTAIAITDRPVHRAPEARKGHTASDKETSGLISFATPSPLPSSPRASAVKQSPSPSVSSSPKPNGSASPRTSAKPSSSPAAPPSEGEQPQPQQPAVVRRSVQSADDSGEYWRLSGGRVRLDEPRGSESREDSSFTVVPGLANSSCMSFRADDGKYLRHYDFSLRSGNDDGSSLFRMDATFCSRASSVDAGAVVLESVNYPGYFLRDRFFQVRLERFQSDRDYAEDTAFRLVDPLG